MSDTKLLVEDYEITELAKKMKLLSSKVGETPVITIENSPKSALISAASASTKFAIRCAPMGKDEFKIGVQPETFLTSIRSRKTATLSIEDNQLLIEEGRYRGWIPTTNPVPWAMAKPSAGIEVPNSLIDAIYEVGGLNKVLETEVLLAVNPTKEGYEFATFDRLHFCLARSEGETAPALCLPLATFQSVTDIDQDCVLSVQNSNKVVAYGKGWFYAAPFVQTLFASIDVIKGLVQKEQKMLGRVNLHTMRDAVADVWSSQYFTVNMEGRDGSIHITTKWKNGKVEVEVDSADIADFTVGLDLRTLNDILSAIPKDVEVGTLSLAGNVVLIEIETTELDVTYGAIALQT